MHAALARHLPSGCHWTPPRGGMFLRVELPAGLDAASLLARAVGAGVAFVPVAPLRSAARRQSRTRCG